MVTYMLEKNPTGLYFSENTVFYQELLQTYQNMGGLLPPHVTVQDVQGDTAEWQRMGTLKMQKHMKFNKVAMNQPEMEKVKILVEEFSTGSPTDTLFENQMKISYRQGLINNLNLAVQRKLDQIILDTLQENVSEYPFVVNENVGGKNTNLNVDKLRKAKRLMDKNNVPAQDRIAIIDVNSEHKLMQEEDVKNSLYNNTKVLVNGSIGSYYGTQLLPLTDIDNEDGLIIENNIRSNFVVQKGAVGLAYSTRPKLEINKIPDSPGHNILIVMSVGCAILNPKGIVHIKTYEDPNEFDDNL